MNPPRIAVAGGYTAGHILPAIEFLRACRAECGAEGFVIGCPGGMEDRIVPDSGERLELISGAPMTGQSWLRKAAAVSSLARGIAAARRLLRRERTELVIGFGSYAATGACLAAYSLGIPFVIHESNAVLGQANRLLLPFARRVCVAFDGVSGDRRVVRTGTPCRAGVASKPARDGQLRILVVGGSQGSPHLNREVPGLIGMLKARREISVVHVTGDFDVPSVESSYRELGVEARVEKFVRDMPALYAGTDFVISSAGGVSLAEIADSALPALLVPLSTASGNHQVANARAFCSETGSLWVPEDDWDATAEARRITALLSDPGALAQLKARTAAWAVRDAAQRMISVCEEVLSG